MSWFEIFYKGVLMQFNILSRDSVVNKELKVPQNDEIQIYLSAVSDHLFLQEDIRKLPECELTRSMDFHQEDDRLRYLVGRALLRRILGTYLNLPANTLSFRTGKHGKPYLDEKAICKTLDIQHIPDIHFNLSHSGEFIAFAFSSASPIGIDIEKIRTNLREEALINRFFHPDEANFFSELSDNEKQDFFFRRWTVREAFLKGLGSGLTISPASFCVSQLSEKHLQKSNLNCEIVSCKITKSQEDYSSWLISTFPAPDGYFCSVAYKQQII